MEQLLERCDRLGERSPSVQEIPSPSHSMQESPPSTISMQDSPPSSTSVWDSPASQSIQDSCPSNQSTQDSPPNNSMGSVLSCFLQDRPLLSHFLQGTSPLGGSLQGSPTLGGSLKGSPPLGGSLQGNPTLGGSLKGSTPLGGSLQGSPTLGGSLKGSPPLGGSLQGSPTQGGSLQGSPPLGGSLQGSPTLSGSLKGSPPLGGSLQGSPTLDGSLKGSPPLGGSLQGSPTLSGSLKGSPPLGGSLQCSPTLGGSLQGSPTLGGSQKGSPPLGGSLQGSPTLGGSLQGSPPLGGSLQGGPSLGGSLQGSPPLGGSLQCSPTLGGSLKGSPPLGGSLQGSPTLGGSLQDSCKPSMSTSLNSDLNYRSSIADGPDSSQFLSVCDSSCYDNIQTPECVPSSTSTSASGGCSGNPVGNHSGCFTGIKTALFASDPTVPSETEEDTSCFDGVRANKISSGDENPANERSLFEDSSHDSSSEARHPPSINGYDDGDSDVSAVDGMHHSLSPPQTPEDMSSSDSESDDDKLGQFFAKMTLQQKENKPLPSSASIYDFVVSDLEDINEDGANDDDQDLLLHLPCEEAMDTPPVYHTPHVPTIGLLFWGSPDATTHPPSSHHIQSGPHTERKPFPYATPKHQATPTLNQLATPSSNKNFSRFKSQMAAELYKMFNKSVFDEQLPPDMEVIWNKKLRTTAGYCYYMGTSSSRTARIELSHKVVDSYDRTLSTLVHEMCHAATWIVDGVKGGHGSVWKAWTEKVRLAYPDLKPITRCHGYQIQYKHHYKCVTCDFEFGRHSKSVSLQTARCPHCGSYLEYVPRLKADGTPRMDRKPTKYAAFVKGHYGTVKNGSPWRTHKQVMEKLSELYKVEK